MGFHTEKRMCACIPSSLPSTICAFISTHITQLYVHYFKRFFKRISNHIKHIGSAQQPKCHWNTITGVKFSSSYPSHCLLSVLSALVSPPLGIIQQETLLQVRDRGKVAVGTLTLNFLSSERLKSQSSKHISTLFVHTEHGLRKCIGSKDKGIQLGKEVSGHILASLNLHNSALLNATGF